MNRISPRMNAVITSCVTLSVVCFTHTASAQFPFDSLFPFSKVDAAPGKNYKLTEDDGPWLYVYTDFENIRRACTSGRGDSVVYYSDTPLGSPRLEVG